jgi:glycosyltransferase involved in cell wall biosynthesis
LLARTADAVIATNQEDAIRLQSWGARHVEVIPIGSNIPDNPPDGYARNAWRAEHSISPDTRLLAYFGFLNSTKGLDDLLRALVDLKRQGDFRLMMVGGGLGSSDPTNRATAKELDDLARDLGVQDVLVWTGYLPPREVSAALRSADIAVLPYADGASFRRGSLLAALEHGLPVVTTSPTSHVQDVTSHFTLHTPRLKNGQNALLVPPGDSAALADAIIRLAADGELLGRLSAAARDLARLFSWDHIAELHEQLYRKVRTLP